jgi:hypothetical protein
VRHGAAAGVVQALRHVAEFRAGADGGDVCGRVHAEVLDVSEVDNDGAVRAAEA